MKKLTLLALSVLLALSAFAFTACGENYVFDSDSETAIKVSSDFMEINADTMLLDYMDKLEEDGQFEFEYENGMLMTVNGKSGSDSIFWMLYTDDADHSNSQWGTYEYEGKTLGSATLGVEQLPVKDGCVYVWVLESF